ncbi:unnamed protein product [Rotaria sordida]|uniref:Phospholipase n=1 Tax=Rotaria sordida TaxID=392033 RepID=A0A814MG60_9BILA|nr:unnamed protein product [Rotaria sordida]
MAHRHKLPSGKILVDHTFRLAEIAMNTTHVNRTNMEQLPFPDENFHEDINEVFQRNNKFTLEHIHHRNGRAFVPNVPVHIISITAEKSHGDLLQLLDTYIYCITVEHGSIRWSIYKRHENFHDLHNELMQFAKMTREKSINTLQPNSNEDDRYPWFPGSSLRKISVTHKILDEHCNNLAAYLNKVIMHPKFRAHPVTRAFFNVSCLSFIDGLSISRKEGFLLKQSNDYNRGHRTLLGQPLVTKLSKHRYEERWLAIKDTYVVYMQPNKYEIRFPILVDCKFKVTSGHHHIDNYYRIKIKNLQCKIVVKCRTSHESEEWMQNFKMLIEQGYGFIDRDANRFNSYAPIRTNQLAHWFINGKSYMEAVARALLTAKEEVFITDWWLSPEIMMIRTAEDETYRLDNLLGIIAAKGVRVYVMVFKELKRVLSLSSLYTKRKLMSKNKNGFIKVLRHPDHHNKNRIIMWSHHEKMVVIDQKIAFVGGIDLCYGRWDDEYMRLVDLGDENITKLYLPSELNPIQPITRQMADRIHAVVATNTDYMRTALHALSQTSEDTESLDSFSINEIQTSSKLSTTKLKKLTPTGVEGDASDSKSDSDESATSDGIVFAFRKHKLQEEDSHVTGRQQFLQQESQDSDDSESDKNFERQQSISSIMIPEDDKRHRLFIGKDYANDYQKGFAIPDKPSEDNINRRCVPRMPWHDEALVILGQGARDVARHFIQRWNIHKCEKHLNNDAYPFLLPKSYSDIEGLTVDNWREFLDSEPFCVDTQCVRSTSLWSSGIKSTEKSIQNAYIQMIGAAKHYIYIENQFFITIAGNRLVKNELAKALFARIKQAHELKEKFRIYVVIPLFPGFDSLNALHAVLFYIMSSITKGDNSLFCRLEKEGITPSDYINFFGMRNHDVLMGCLVTEIVYVHSKLMIVDDSMAICGSANINDRSLLGDRDSEFCIVIKDREEVDGRFNGKPVRVGKFCSSWRKKIFEMLLGIQFENPNNIDITDPVSDKFYTYFRQVARKNTKIYEKVFGTIPTDQVRTFAQSSKYSDAKYMRDTDPLRAQEQLKSIQGFIVEYPIYFLHDENYLPKKRTREGIVPLVTWT